MGLIVGSARIDERGKLSGGQAGDQTGKEVCTQQYYMHSKGWYVLRAKDISVANGIAKAMKQACDNNNIGYDQNERSGVITQLKRYGNLAKIAKATECDCSSLVRACVYQASGTDVGNFTTANEASTLENSGLFEKKKAVSSSTTLYDGDILVTKTKGHTVVVTSGNARGQTTISQPAPVTKSSNYDDWVCRLQKELNRQGYTDYDRKKLVEDGENGKHTLSACPTVKKGAKGNITRLIQERLVSVGFSLTVDGDFGSTTLAKVKKFQSNRGLTSDGIVGKNTWSYLLSGKSV